MKTSLIIAAATALLWAQSYNWHWPVEGILYEDHFVNYYVDHSDSTDYRGGRITYKGHPGTDFGVDDPKQVDRGVRLQAVADGLVLRADNKNPVDRPYESGKGPNNTIEIRHNDSLVLFYSHNRYNSIMVKAGDSVRAGQPLCFMGSSGYSKNVHIHFEINRPWIDPFTLENQKKYWGRTIPYSGDVFAVREFKLLTEKGLDFKWKKRTTYKRVAKLFKAKRDSAKLHTPKVYGADEAQLFLYWQTVNRPKSMNVSLCLLGPDMMVHYEKKYAAHEFPLKNILPMDFRKAKPGKWKVQLLGDDRIFASMDFTVGKTSRYAPLFSPVSGKSFWVEKGGATPLAVSRLSGRVTYSVANPNTAVSIVDSLSGKFVKVSGKSDQQYRSHMVHVLAANRAGVTDTFFVHLVDFDKPVEPLPVWKMVQY